jgi:hypothetical protein
MRCLDVSKFKLVVSQAYDSIQASADWLSRDKKDVEQVSAAMSPPMVVFMADLHSGSRRTSTFECRRGSDSGLFIYFQFMQHCDKASQKKQ